MTLRKLIFYTEPINTFARLCCALMLFAADVVAGTHLINAIDLDDRWLTWDKAAFNGAIGTYGRAPDCAEIVWSERVFLPMDCCSAN